MSDYIKREDAIDVIEITPFEDYGDYIKAREIIENLPTIEAVPKDFHDKTCEAMAKRHTEEIQRLMPKRGEWIVHKARTEVNDGLIDFFPTEYECSNCGLKQSMYFINSKPSNFCPNCGADMREREGE